MDNRIKIIINRTKQDASKSKEVNLITSLCKVDLLTWMFRVIN